MGEVFRKFKPAGYFNDEGSAQALRKAASEEDDGDGAAIRAALKHVA